jgi:dynein regulatory complex subunit 2
VSKARVETIWEEWRRAFKNYDESTEERKNHFENLKTKDEKSAAEIERQMKKLQRIGERIANLRSRMAQNAKEYDERNRELKEERETMLLHFQELKGQMNKLREIEREHLTKMTLESTESIKETKRLIEKGERIIKLGENCRKLETEEEKVLPFYATSLTAEEEEDVRVAMQEEMVEELAEVMQKYSHLETFWKRFNKVELERLAMEKEKYMLVQENQQLRAWLKQYLDGISVNDEILAQQNSLVVINGRTNVPLSGLGMDPRVRVAPPVQLEASHIVQHNITSGILR